AVTWCTTVTQAASRTTSSSRSTEANHGWNEGGRRCTGPALRAFVASPCPVDRRADLRGVCRLAARVFVEPVRGRHGTGCTVPEPSLSAFHRTARRAVEGYRRKSGNRGAGLHARHSAFAADQSAGCAQPDAGLGHLALARHRRA